MFTLYKRLKEDCAEVVNLGLSLVLLMNDAELPWLILVPRRADIRELHELGSKDRAELMEEVALASRVIEALYKPDKLNVGMLGNIVPQLHVHVIGRFAKDRAWPGSVWGCRPGRPYGKNELVETARRFKEAFAALGARGLE